MTQTRRVVPRYSRAARVTLDPQPVVARGPSIFETVRNGLDKVISFVRPAAVEEQTQRGTAEALDDFRDGKYKKRRPYGVRSEAYNAAAERAVGAKVRTAWSQGISEVVNGAKDVGELEAGINGLTDSVMDGLGDEFATVRQSLVNQGAAMFELTRGRFAKPGRVVARDKAAAKETAAAVRNTAQQAATGEPSAEAAEALLREAAIALSEHGPQDAFSIGGLEFPASSSRSGTMSVDEIEAEVKSVAVSLQSQLAANRVRDADVPSAVVRDLESDRTLTVDIRDVMARAARAELDQKNATRREAEAAAVRTFSRIEGRAIPPDMPSPPQLPISARIGEAAGRRQAEIESEFSQSSLRVAGQLLDQRLGDLSPAGDAERVEELQLYLNRVGELAADGRIADDPTALEPFAPVGRLEHGRKEWGDRAEAFLSAIQERPPLTVEDVEDIEQAASVLSAQGRQHGRDARVEDLNEKRALERVKAGHVRKLRQTPVNIARGEGQEVDDLDLESVPSMIESLIVRSSQMGAARDLLDLTDGNDLNPVEVDQVVALMETATDAERAAFVEAVAELPLQERRYMADAFRFSAPTLAGVIMASAFAAGPAALALKKGATPARVDTPAIQAIAGPEAAALADDLASVGVSDIENVVTEELASDPVKAALRDRVAPEDLDESLGSVDRILSSRAERPFDREPDQADMMGLRIAREPHVARLAEAVRYLPDDPAAVQAFTRMVESLEALPEDERDAFVEEQRKARVEDRIAGAPMPLYYAGESLSMDGLKAAAATIVQEYRRGAISDDVYAEQAALVQRLVEELN